MNPRVHAAGTNRCNASRSKQKSVVSHLHGVRRGRARGEARIVSVQMLLAGFWGLVAGSALVLGAAVGYFARVPQRVIAGIMAFGGGVLISALSFDLMDEAYKRGGFDSTAIGFIGGAAIYTAANWFLAQRGAKHRKRSNGHQPTEDDQ